MNCFKATFVPGPQKTHRMYFLLSALQPRTYNTLSQNITDLIIHQKYLGGIVK